LKLIIDRTISKSIREREIQALNLFILRGLVDKKVLERLDCKEYLMVNILEDRHRGINA
jgi:hypothetical protein